MFVERPAATSKHLQPMGECMRFCRCCLLVLFFLVPNVWAAEAAQADTAQSQMQAEQGKHQALADALWHYLGAEPARMRKIDEAAGRLYELAFKEGGTADKLPDATTIGLSAWQEALVPLHTLGLPPAAVSDLKALEQNMKAATRTLSAIPVADGSAKRRIERQQALMAAASALGVFGQQALRLDGQLQEEARRAAATASLLSTQMLMLPAVKKGEAP